MDPERSDNCFSLHTRERTVDFEVDNPWLVLLVVRALRLFLGAHYDTLPAPTFFSHLCVRPAPPPPPPTGLAESPKKPLVWAGEGGHGGVGSPVKEPTSTPTERTSGDSASDDSGPSGRSQAVVREPSPWDTDVVTAARAAEAVQVAGREEGDEDEDEDEDDEDEEEEEEDEEEVLRAARELDGDTDCGSALDEAGGRGDARRCYPPAPDGQAPLTMTDDRDDLGVMATETAEAKRPAGEEEHEEGLDDLYGTDVRSPGGIMALFSAGKRGPEDFGLGSSGGRGEEELAGSPQAVPEEPGPLTASQLLATRGMSKRLSLAKKLSAANAAGGAALKGKRFDLMALPMDPTGQERRDRGGSEHAEPAAPSEVLFVLFAVSCFSSFFIFSYFLVSLCDMLFFVALYFLRFLLADSGRIGPETPLVTLSSVFCYWDYFFFFFIAFSVLLNSKEVFPSATFWTSRGDSRCVAFSPLVPDNIPH